MVGVKICASMRPNTKGSYRKHMRDNGKIPAVVYGKGIKEEAIELYAKDLESLIRKRGRNILIDLEVKEKPGQKKYVVMIKELQRDPIYRKIVHVDLCKVSLEDKIRTTVPVVLKGEPVGKKAGGVLQTGLRELEIECTPDKLPDIVSVDISSLETGQRMTVADLVVSDDLTILTELDKTVVLIAAPTIVEDPDQEEPEKEHKGIDNSGEAVTEGT
ncbi:50S ribosomal protein L25 [Phosphitispora sp. TUW77]|uniref:50S ribosomal protein L25 n=1 Tax=Phosphitispora sp. TUW77 TaxID=3152361 RepID=UPI003AB41A6E